MVALATVPPPILAQVTFGDCSPVIEDVNGDVKVECIFIKDAGERLAVAQRNIDYVLTQYYTLGTSNYAFFEPEMRSYIKNPTPARWAALKDYANLTHDLVIAAITSLIVSQPSIDSELQPHLDKLKGLATARNTLLQELLAWAEPPTAEQAEAWRVQYADLIMPLLATVAEVRAVIGGEDGTTPT
ncbi:MAG: hypothetical protein EOP22_05545 [Hyphomicrobiales bacterium]|nr:MAG: hypothetical protein EOP22_05545 [Hyphomicrobiales bacterium]